ncbi:CDP-glucose 4,6-dehydratase [Polynucleobacter sp. AP-Ainpum-60-G11]|uniref:CDP-glucose 4,6-dehydratase n=1 Tax=Polynucleobacter sp. AP-Ainpum-60-G11 TaxID=2576926 RepID=UPI0020402417|nr:CDP-glucose 4,6-dehydratase [Polynucleobacter sp. AP-Ainpum-60-G11]QWE27628.1 CDP-glucose 4,6-dehydratase [Polynucleobacter sp. AP-Ainpum-60-G11]
MNIFNSKKVLITGNTGFKGSWLTAWLIKKGANVTGYSNNIPTNPSHYLCANLDKSLVQIFGDIRNAEHVKKTILELRPDYIFHLAAQPLVKESYKNPKETFEVNAIGTLNVLEGLRHLESPCSVVLVTSDKVYYNQEQIWGYRENDSIGGSDPYSASKGAAELIIKSYINSYFQNSDIRIGICRAGNVIGGGDWAEDRIVPDIARSWASNKVVNIRNPNATRPWQHVLEPLYGYLILANKLAHEKDISGEAYNFGPTADQNYTVKDLLLSFQKILPSLQWELGDCINVSEASLLKLCCDKSLSMLGWKPRLSIEQNITLTAEWYKKFYQGKDSMIEITESQIDLYEKIVEGR